MKLQYKALKNLFINRTHLEKNEIVDVLEFHLVVGQGATATMLTKEGHYLRISTKQLASDFRLERVRE